MGFRSSEVPDFPGLAGYMEEVSRQFCPFIRPSARFGTMHFSVYDLECEVSEVESSIFYLGLLHTEVLRAKRREVAPNAGNVACENVIFRFPEEYAVDGSELFAWPHWLLKVHYTKTGVMFGKFWIGEEDETDSGRPIPPPPYHLLSVRSAILGRDPKFFDIAPRLATDLTTSYDDGECVVDTEALAGIRLPGDLASLTHCTFVYLYRLLQDSGMYEQLKAEQAALLEEA